MNGNFCFRDVEHFENMEYGILFVAEAILAQNLSGNFRYAFAIPLSIFANKVVLAADTLATTRLALHFMLSINSVSMMSCPTAAFMLRLPTSLGKCQTNDFALGQLSHTIAQQNSQTGFGSMFSTTGIPVTEFARHIPLRRRYGIDVLRSLLSSCVTGNLFLSGHLTTCSLRTTSNGILQVSDRFADEVMKSVRKRLRRVAVQLGALLVPKSFTTGAPGSDIHYSSTLPMSAALIPDQTDRFGELFGLEGVYVADGASLCSLTEKPRTLTIMANADRIGNKLASELNGNLEQ